MYLLIIKFEGRITKTALNIGNGTTFTFFYDERNGSPTLKGKINGPLSDEKWAFLQIYKDKGKGSKPFIFLDTCRRDGNIFPYYTSHRETGGAGRSSNYSDEPINNLMVPGKVVFFTVLCEVKTEYSTEGTKREDPKSWSYKMKAGIKWGFELGSQPPNVPTVLPLFEMKYAEMRRFYKIMTENRERFYLNSITWS